LYDSPETERPVGFGIAIDDPNLQPMAAKGTAVFAEAVRLVADAIGVDLDDITCVAEYAETTEDLPMASWTIPAGHVAGVYASWQGIVNGTTVIDINVRWKKGQTLKPDWKLDGDGWKITIDGRPTVNMRVGFLPPKDMIESAKTIEDFFVLGHIMTAMPPIHAIPAVVAAAPGIATYNGLPLTLPRATVPAAEVGSAHQTSIGWVRPGRPPLTGGQLRAYIEKRGAAWLLEGVDVSDGVFTYRRAASAAIPEPSTAAIPVGDAALVRDALASQGLSIGLSDACLVADPATTVDDMTRRRNEAILRHFRHLGQMATTCRYADSPRWARYLAWVTQASTGWSSEPTTALARHGAN
jgi:2,4-diaminopentanoate dehydrogenase-like protein